MSTVSAIRISDLPSSSSRRERFPAEAATMTAPNGSVKESAKVRLNAGAWSDDDAEREVERAAGADERAGQLQVCAGLDEDPALLLAETEHPELVVPPADDPLIFGGELLGWRELGCGHTCSNEHIRAEFVGRS